MRAERTILFEETPIRNLEANAGGLILPNNSPSHQAPRGIDLREPIRGKRGMLHSNPFPKSVATNSAITDIL